MLSDTPGKLRHLSDTLASSVQYGAEVDEPEGERYIKISVTLARELTGWFRDLAHEYEMMEEELSSWKEMPR